MSDLVCELSKLYGVCVCDMPLTRESTEGAIMCDTPPHVRALKAQSYVTHHSLHDRTGTLASAKYVAVNLYCYMHLCILMAIV